MINRHSIRFRLNLIFAVLVSVLLTVFSSISYISNKADLYTRYAADRVALRQRLEIHLGGALWRLDMETLQRNLSAELEPPVLFISIWDESSKSVIASVRSPETGAQPELEDETTFPMVVRTSGDQYVSLGSVTFITTRKQIEATLQDLVRDRVAETIILVILLTSALSFALSRSILRPLDALRSALARAASHTDSTAKIEIPGDRKDEFGEVGKTMGLIAHRLVDDLKRQELAESELRQVHASQIEMTEKLLQSEKLASLGSLVAGVAHELNTPIGNAILTADTLRQTTSDFSVQIKGKITRSEMERYLDNTTLAAQLLLRNLRRAGDLVQGFKQISADQSSEQRRKFSLSDIAHEVTLIMSPKLRQTRHVINVDVAPEIVFDSYPGPLTQVLINFIENSLRHGFSGIEAGEMHLHARKKPGDLVEIVFSDDGNGMAAETSRRVFEPFFTTKLGQGGSGLGMNIVYNIVTNMLGGEIEVETEPGKGCRWIVQLPLTAP